MRFFLALIFLSLFLSKGGFAASLKGVIVEEGSGEAAVGAVAYIEGQNQWNDVAGFDGSFHIKNIPEGKYTLKVYYIGFETYTTEVEVKGDMKPLKILLVSKQSTLDEIHVVGKSDQSSENTARGMEREANQVMNIVSGKAIQISPDITVANVIQRVSGISLERNSNGDGQFAILRGMDKRYNYTLVNGIKIPSPDNKYRYVPLDIFPSELLDRLEVYKALTPEMEGDAVGGAINMVMKDAPDSLRISANIASGYSELFANRDFTSFNYRAVNSQSPYEIYGNKYNAQPSDFSTASYEYSNGKPLPNLLGGISIGNRFFKKKLGVIVAGSYQRTNRGSNSTFFDFDKVDTLKGVTLTKYDRRTYSEEQERSGIHLKSDFRISERHKLQLYTAYINLTNIQLRDVNAMQLTIGGYDPEAGNATLNYSTRSRITRQNIYNSTLQGEHYLSSHFKINWSAVYSKASQEVPDNTTIPLLGTRKNFVETKTYIQDATRRWEHNSDEDLAGYLRLGYDWKIKGTLYELSTGGLYRSKNRENFYNQYQLRPSDLQALYGEDFHSYTEIRWVVQNPRGSVASSLNYAATENIGAGFLQFKIQPKRMEIIGGVRAEHTQQGYAMKFPIGEDKPEGEQVYLDFLPSLHFKIMPVTKVNVRASYYRSVNRPGFFEIVPYKIVNEEYQERGNPNLKRAIADNLDVRYEWYPRVGEQIMAGAFYKRIQDPIEYTLQRDPVRGQDIFYAPGNYGTAQNFGIEIDAIKYFQKFGIKANYTYTHSAITTPKSQRIRNSAGNLQTISVDQTRPLYGQAAHIGNLSLLYKDPKEGWNLQLAANYTGERIVTVSQFLNNDLWQKAFIQMDFSAEKSVGGQWTVFVKMNNLLNTPMEVYMKEGYNNKEQIPEQTLKNETLIRKDYYQRSYMIGVRWKLK